MSTYEQIRLKNIEDNKRVLRDLGLLNPFKPLPRVVHRTTGQKRKRDSDSYKLPRKVAKVFAELDENKGSVFTPENRRRSTRIQGVAAASSGDIDVLVRKELQEEDGDENRRTPRVTPNRPKFYGAVPGVDVGTWWEQRIACSAVGVHRPTVAGIHGGDEGCYSLALSGGYEDDIDMGECFTYTGEGGRDLKGTKANPKNLRTAAQSKDQTLSRGNLALSLSLETGNPVRVIRGYKLRSPFAPEDGYRYDGLYRVEKYWYTVGLSGFGVYKFALRRVTDQAPPPWDLVDTQSTESSQDSRVGSDAHTVHLEREIGDTEENILTVVMDDLEKKEIGSFVKDDLEKKDICNVVKDDLEKKDICNVVKDDLENDVCSGVKDAREKDISNIVEDDPEKKDISNIVKDDLEKKDISNIVKDDLEKNEVPNIVKDDLEKNDDLSVVKDEDEDDCSVKGDLDKDNPLKVVNDALQTKWKGDVETNLSEVKKKDATSKSEGGIVTKPEDYLKPTLGRNKLEDDLTKTGDNLQKPKHNIESKVDGHSQKDVAESKTKNDIKTSLNDDLRGNSEDRPRKVTVEKPIVTKKEVDIPAKNEKKLFPMFRKK